MYGKPWNVLHVTANHEKRVVQHLDAHQIEHYLPLYTEKSQWSDRAVRLERPLFAGYVFIRFLPRQRLSIVSIPGVLHLLGGTGCDTVSTEELERIRTAMASGYQLRPHVGMAVGTNVRVRGGIFDGVRGVVADLRNECKVIIALSGVQQCFSLEIAIDQLEVVDMTPRLSSNQPSLRAYH